MQSDSVEELPLLEISPESFEYMSDDSSDKKSLGGVRHQENLFRERSQGIIVTQVGWIRRIAFFYQKDDQLADAVSRDAAEVEYSPEDDVRHMLSTS